MDEQQVRLLLNKYNDGKATADEIKLLEHWYLAAGRMQHLNAEEEDFGGLKQEIWNGTLQRAGLIEEPKQGKIYSLSRRLRWPLSIAAAFTAITLGVWLYYSFAPSRHLDDRRDLLTSANDIAPGKSGATLTLANGKVIQLSDAKTGVVVGQDLKYSDGTALSGLQPSLPEGERNMALTARTTKGQTYEFTLSDGTKVWLNAASSLKFPSKFTGNERIVELTGEGYFEVAKDKRHKFMVRSAGQELTVLGTHFNVNSYADEGSVRTTLLEGSVRVAPLSPPGGEMAAGQRGEERVLKPNQQAILTTNNPIKVKEVDINEAVAWKNGKFVFSGTSLEAIMRQLGRWYNLEVSYEGKIPQRTFNGVIERDVNLSQILDVLKTGGIKFRIEEPAVKGGLKRIIVQQ